MEALRVHNALTVPLPEPPLVTEHYTRTAYLATDDEQISEATLLNSASQLQVTSQITRQVTTNQSDTGNRYATGNKIQVTNQVQVTVTYR